MAKKVDRLAQGLGPLVCFALGVLCVGFTFGLGAAASVLCVGFALVGEFQRKVNQILDVLEGEP